ncbi:MAG: N-acetylmuramoyl-L-alanine amidase [bacterium]|nr:N-acetylmuramoyl-L-alanine amidase [bacterium]
MIKRFIYTVFVVLFMLISPALGYDFRIVETKIDYSGNEIIFKGNNISQNVRYTAGFSQEPLRAYIDLDDCVFAENKKTLEFPNNSIKKIVIAQNSVNPNKVRLVFYANTMEELKKIRLIKNGYTLLFKLQDFSYGEKQIPVIFSDVLPKEYKEAKSFSFTDAKFSKYILTNILETSSGLLFTGVGNVKLSRPFILKDPIRIVFDMQNATAQYKELYGEHKLPNGDSIKIGQFNEETLRFVVTTENPVLYKSFISPDLQSIYITNINEMKEGALPNANIASAIKKITVKQSASQTETYITMEFDNPVVHSIRRTYNKFLFDFLNVDFSTNEPLIKTAKTSQFGGFIAQKMSEKRPTLSLLFPVSDTLKVETGLAQDGRTIAIKLTGNLGEVKTPDSRNPINIIKPSSNKYPLKGKVIVVDAGHGGKDVGALSGQKYEKVSALIIAQMLQKNLEEKGATVIMTRSDDTFISLQDRVSISNYENADLFVSVHLNSSEKSNIHGIETHWYKPNSQDLAKYVQNALIKEVPAVNRGLFKSMFYVINHTTAPAILVETGFISNPQERDELFEEKRQKATAKAICEGITEYFEKKK